MPEFRMPDIGEGLTEAEIVEWFVRVGDEVAVGQTVVEVETAKTTVEIPSPFGGVLTARSGEEGDTIEVDDVLFVIDGDVDAPTPTGQGETDDTAGTHTEQDESSPAHAVAARATGVKAVPAVRRLAKDLGVDLAMVEGSGPDGAITRNDVRAAGESTSMTPAETSTELSSIRRAIAAHMTESWTTIPHVTVQAEVRAEALVAGLRGGRSIESQVAAAALPLLAEFPEFNGRYEDGALVTRTGRHLGFAVDTEAGLLVAVVRDADGYDIEALDAEIERVQTAARSGTLVPDEAIGQTFTISNIGALGGGHGTPIIPMGTSAIVSIGRAVEQPIVEAGEIDIGMVAPLDLSYDHRLIDGSLGQRFLGALVERLESGPV